MNGTSIGDESSTCGGKTKKKKKRKRPKKRSPLQVNTNASCLF